MSFIISVLGDPMAPGGLHPFGTHYFMGHSEPL